MTLSFPQPYYPQIFAVKALIHHQDKYLLIQEPLTASWKPGKWGLPGGKVDQGEDWVTAFHREMGEELGQVVIPVGLIAIEEIVYLHPIHHEQQLTHHLVFMAKMESKTPFQTQLKCKHEWLTLPELLNKPVDDLAEFYLPDLWKLVAQPNFTLLPLERVIIWDDAKVSEFKAWYQK